MADFSQLLHGWNQLWWVRLLAYVTTAAVLVIAGFALGAYRHVPLTRRQKIAAVCFAVLMVDELVLLFLGSSGVIVTVLNLSTAAALRNVIRQLERRLTAG